MILIHYSEGAGDHAIATAIADIRLHKHRADLGADDRPSGTCLEASRIAAVLTDIREKLPAKRILRTSDLRAHAGLAAPET